MSEFEQETLSALLDGEADELELRRLLRAMESDPELARRWERYHLAQSVLHDRGITVSDTLVSKVTGALREEPTANQPTNPVRDWTRRLTPTSKGRPPSGLLQQLTQPLSKIAIAASVTAVAVLFLQADSPTPSDPTLVQEATPSPASPAPTQVQQSTPLPEPVAEQSQVEAIIAEVTTAADLDPAAQQRLREYIEAMRFDPEDPEPAEPIQDSPLYRLVNEYQQPRR